MYAYADADDCQDEIALNALLQKKQYFSIIIKL